MLTKIVTICLFLSVAAGCAGVGGTINDAAYCSGGVLNESSCSLPDTPIQVLNELNE